MDSNRREHSAVDTVKPQFIKDTGGYEIIEMVHWGFRVVLDGEKS